MSLNIDDHRTIADVQQQFQTLFPFLKLEFFSVRHKGDRISSGKSTALSSKTLGECRVRPADGTFTLAPQMTVAELERRFRETYGLSAQVFRKSGKTWLETTVTDDWPLEKQNQQGEELSRLSGAA